MSNYYGLRPLEQNRRAEALNGANRDAREWHAKFSAAFEGLVGKKVLKVDGFSLSKAAQAAIDGVSPNRGFNDPRPSLGGRHRLAFRVGRSWHRDGDDWRSVEASFLVGEIDDRGILARLVPDDEDRRFDRSGAEVRVAIEAARAARDAANEANSVLARLDW